MPEVLLTPSATVCVIGFGESGAALATALAQRGYAVRAWDILLDDTAARDAMRSLMAGALVYPALSMADAMQGAKLVICAVGAATSMVMCEAAAKAVAGQELMDFYTTTPAQLALLGFAYDPAMRQAVLRGELP
ncbi:MAG: NAD(P)-binding domain-containing protein [Pseudomonadota bacterium]